MKTLRSAAGWKVAVAGCLLLAVSAGSATGESRKPSLSRGQTVYVSVYSNVFAGPKARPLDLETILSIRNTDLKASLTVTAIDFYDTEGRLIRRHLPAPQVLKPLGTKYLHLRESETSGGPGSNFIVKWKATKPMNPPIIETVMLGLAAGQGISFVTQGQVVQE